MYRPLQLEPTFYGLFLEDVAHNKSFAMPLVYLNSNKGRLGLSNELQQSTELPVDPKWPAVKFGSFKRKF